MKPTELFMALDVALDANNPAFVWGSPGIGKSAIIRQLAAHRGMKVFDLRASQLDAVDTRGLPYLEPYTSPDGRSYKIVRWAAPSFLPTENEPSILFLDELNAAPALVQAALYQLILEKRLGDYALPPKCRILAAGNKETDRAVTTRMSSALANRFYPHLDLEVDLDDWVSWALVNDILIEIIAFIRYRPALLHAFDPTKNEKAFPAPRSWEGLSNLFKIKTKAAIEYALAEGCIGKGAATEYLSFLKIYRELPDLDALIADPENAPLPKNPATNYAICGALSRKATPNNFDRICRYGARMQAEFRIMLVKWATEHKPALKTTDAFVKWAVANKGLLI